MSKVSIISILLLSAVIVGLVTAPPMAKVRLKVTDEFGIPISQATVKFAFSSAYASWGNDVGVTVTTTTDAYGMAIGSGYSGGTIGCNVNKDGYYEGGPDDVRFNNVSLGEWQPWNAIYSVVLKKVINPIPMYAKKVEIRIPALNEPIGYDLTVGDWIRPFGKGTIGDFIFDLTRTQNGPNYFDEHLVLAFANKGDGIQLARLDSGQDHGWSRLKFPRNAPESGYIDSWTSEVTYDVGGYKEQHSNGIGYYYRVRTVFNAKGNIQSTNYGKIEGDIKLFRAGTANPSISFIYYFNQAGTTNLEFDTTRNLLPVASFEIVSRP